MRIKVLVSTWELIEYKLTGKFKTETLKHNTGKPIDFEGIYNEITGSNSNSVFVGACTKNPNNLPVDILDIEELPEDALLFVMFDTDMDDSLLVYDNSAIEKLMRSSTKEEIIEYIKAGRVTELDDGIYECLVPRIELSRLVGFSII